jgi:hypothetical protein
MTVDTVQNANAMPGQRLSLKMDREKDDHVSRARIVGCAMTVMTGLGLSACATVDPSRPGQPIALESETIRYETAPCYGTCPVYAVTITAEGKGTFEGKSHTTVTGIRTFQATPAAYRAFAARLVPYRPTGNEMLYQPGTPNCGNAPSDMPSVDVVWTELNGGRQHLNVYYGCGPQAMRDALRAAPNELPIGSMIGDGQR